MIAHKVYTKWAFAACLVIVAFLALVQILFSVEAPFGFLRAVWTPDGLLGFAGGVIGAAGTVCAVVMTISDSDRARADDRRDSVAPLIALDYLDRRGRSGPFDIVGGSQDADDVEVGSREERYREVSPRETYAIVGNVVRYRSSLTEDQRRHVEMRTLPRADPSGVTVFEANSTLYIPIGIKNMGKGPAINLSMSLEEVSSLGEIPVKGRRSGPIMQLAPGDEAYMGIYFEDVTALDSARAFQIVSMCHDIIGNGYRQGFGFNLKPIAGVGAGVELSYRVSRELISSQS